MTVRLLDAGDAAFTVEFGSVIDPSLLAAVQSLEAAIEAARAAGAMPGLIETMPTFRSLTILFDPLVTGRRELVETIEPLLEAAQHAALSEGRRWRLPVCYEGDAGPDLAETARVIGASVDDVIDLHRDTEDRIFKRHFSFPVAPRTRPLTPVCRSLKVAQDC